MHLEEDAIKSARRLGIQSAEKRYRPLLMKVDEKLREKMLLCKSKLKKINEEKGERYRIDPDLTKAQQEQYSELWKEAERRTDASKNRGAVGCMGDPEKTPG